MDKESKKLAHLQLLNKQEENERLRRQDEVQKAKYRIQNRVSYHQDQIKD